jgi:hypothetical protein
MKAIMPSINLFCAFAFFFIGITKWDPTGKPDDTFTAICFMVFIASFIPFIVTYTKLGLNPPEGGPIPMPDDIKERHKTLKQSLPDWKFAFPVFAVMTLCFWPILDGMFSFMFCGSLFSLYWFSRAYPVASRLFREERGR